MILKNKGCGADGDDKDNKKLFDREDAEDDSSSDEDDKDFRLKILSKIQKNRDHDREPLGITGSRGAIFKVTLTSLEYTVAAKGTVFAFISDLVHEESVYARLRPLQGECVPVCLGSIKLPTPYFYDLGVEIIHMMLLAWGGESMELSFPIHAQRVDKKASRAIEAIHRFEVLHKDAMPRNMLWNEALKRVLFIDFERSQIREVQAGKRVLGIISPNQKKRENDPMQIAKEAGDEKVVSTAGDVSKAAETETIDEILFAHELKEVRWALAEKAAGA